MTTPDVKKYEKRAFAHSKEGLPPSEWQPLADHLHQVAELAADFAACFQSSDWAWNAGLLHDIGKLDPLFQNYLRRVNGLQDPEYDQNGHNRVNHSSAGGALAEAHFPMPVGRILSYLIAGHHAGLPDYIAPDNPLAELRVRLDEGRRNLERISGEADHYIRGLRPLNKPPEFVRPESLHLWIRMLYSCLVDADSLDTERFMNPQRAAERSRFQPLARLKEVFDIYMEELVSKAVPSPVNMARKQIFTACREAGHCEPGLFSLTVPTGGGKTLSSVGFALEHALAHDKKRIIYVIPYTSIIEQTSTELRRIFGNDQVVEHHSNVIEINETPQAILAAENWNASIVVTTNVQFFESLFSCRSSRCRKLHNLSQSVVILDEAQLLPPKWLSPCVQAINFLSEHYGVTLLLSTATQPALPGIAAKKEIIPDPKDLYKELIRTEIRFPNDFNSRTDWGGLADELKGKDQVLCVVNTRRDCYELFQAMPERTIHLSALMCGEHRSRVIAHIKEELRAGRTVRVISTQLVEAGVDFDFPVVYRAMAGLDSIAQAAGRCNREGMLNKQGKLGVVQVFVPPKPSPLGQLRKGEDKCRELALSPGFDPQRPEVYYRYFEHLYSSLNDDGSEWLKNNLMPDRLDFALNLRTAGNEFKVIDDRDREPVLVSYASNSPLLEKLRADGPKRDLLRRLQRFTVSLSRHDAASARENGLLEELYPGFWLWRGNYDPVFGLDLWGAGWAVEDLVV